MSDSVTVDTGGADALARSLADAADSLANPTPLVTDLGAQVASVAGAHTPRATGAVSPDTRASASKMAVIIPFDAVFNTMWTMVFHRAMPSARAASR